VTADTRTRSFHLRISRQCIVFCGLACTASTLLMGQSVPSPAQARPSVSGSVEPNDSEASARDQYRLGPEDQISITVRFADELNNKTFTVDSAGFINIPFAGRVKVVGSTVVQLEQDLAVKLNPYFKNPDVVVNIVQYGSKPVSVVGEVQNPAVHQLRGRLSLMELLSASGGLTQEAGAKLQITRQMLWGPLPLPNAHTDASGAFSIAEVDLSELLAGNPAQNILLCPNDTVTVPRARLIYVLGDVHKPGGFPLREAESASVLQAVALAQGPLATASRKHVHILRTQLGGVRQDIPIDLEKILDREHPDVLLQPEDVLYVPNSKAKNATLRGLETAIQIGTGLVIWGRY
jgi:polysaccharide biosynthesis/export protein